MRFAVTRTSLLTQLKDGNPPMPDSVRESDGWYIDVPDLEALMGIVKEHGQVIVSEEPGLEIYDDYRE